MSTAELLALPVTILAAMKIGIEIAKLRRRRKKRQKKREDGDKPSSE